MSAPPAEGRPLRVLHVIDSLCRGGAESMLATLLHGLARHGRVRSIVRAGRVEEADPALAAAVGRDSEDLAFLRCEHVYDPRFAVGLLRTIRARRIDVVHSHLAVASVNSRLAARPLGRPHVTTIHTMPGSTLTDTRAWLLADSLTARLSRLHVAPSQEVADACARHYRLAADRFRVIPNAPAPAPAAPSAVQRAELRAQLRGDGGEGPIVLAVARLVPGKGVDDLLEACASLRERVPGLRVAVAGAGPERERLEAEAARRGLQTSFRLLGHRDDVGRLLAVVDAFCLPSHHEAAPIGLLEAMQAGLACVATAVGAVPEMLEAGRCGVLVAAGRPAELADGLGRVLADGELAAALGARAREVVARRYSVAVVTEAYVGLYRELGRGF